MILLMPHDIAAMPLLLRYFALMLRHIDYAAALRA